MAHYKCPIKTCNVKFSGSVWDIEVPAIMHAEGSHQTSINLDIIRATIKQQADPFYEAPAAPESPVEEESKEEVLPGVQPHIPPHPSVLDENAEDKLPYGVSKSVSHGGIDKDKIDPDWWKN